MILGPPTDRAPRDLVAMNLLGTCELSLEIVVKQNLHPASSIVISLAFSSATETLLPPLTPFFRLCYSQPNFAAAFHRHIADEIRGVGGPQVHTANPETPESPPHTTPPTPIS